MNKQVYEREVKLERQNLKKKKVWVQNYKLKSHTERNVSNPLTKK